MSNFVDISTFILRNSAPTQSKPKTQPFTLTAPPQTDLWREPPVLNVFTSPVLYTCLKLSAFHSARVTVSGPWKTLYDQGGLALLFPDTSDPSAPPRKWVKTGIEFSDGRVNLSTVATDRWSDWSLIPLAPEDGGKVTLEIERGGVSLWVYIVDSNGKRTGVRQVTWVFEEAELEHEIWVGAYVAKPQVDEGDESGERGIEVTFDGFEIRKV